MKIRISIALLLVFFIHACASSSAGNRGNSVARAAKTPVQAKLTPTPAEQAVLDLLGKVDQLQNEIQQLRGQLEEQAYAIEDLKKRHTTAGSNFEQRLQMLEITGSSDGQSDKGLPSEIAEIQKPLVPQGEAPINKKVTGIEKQVYLAAYENLRNGHYNQAISMFKQVIFDYPDGEYADNAQYWLGETYKVNQDIPAAREAFKQVIDNYPESAKVPDAMLKLAYIEIEQQQPDKAREYLLKIIDDYRDSTAAHLAETKLMELDGARVQ